MTVQVLFFGATADSVGEREIDFFIKEASTADEVFGEIVKKYPRLTEHKLLFSLNQEYARGGELIRDGDELAIFTAVSGG